MADIMSIQDIIYYYMSLDAALKDEKFKKFIFKILIKNFGE